MLKKISACSVVREMIVIASFTRLCLKDKSGLCSINCHIHAMNGNCSASLRVLANSLQVVSAITGTRLSVSLKTGTESTLIVEEQWKRREYHPACKLIEPNARAKIMENFSV